jgi:hypothetical protein
VNQALAVACVVLVLAFKESSAHGGQNGDLGGRVG